MIITFKLVSAAEQGIVTKGDSEPVNELQGCEQLAIVETTMGYYESGLTEVFIDLSWLIAFLNFYR